MENVKTIFVDFCNSDFPLRSIDDERVINLKKAFSYFVEWEKYKNENMKKHAGGATEANETFLAHQTWFTLKCIVNGFLIFIEWFCETHDTEKYFIIPKYLCQNGLELIFSWIRCHLPDINPKNYAKTVGGYGAIAAAKHPIIANKNFANIPEIDLKKV
jgi:hypothetical protein